MLQRCGVKVTLGESNGWRVATKPPGVRTLLYMPTRRAPFLASSSFSESVLKTSLCQSFVRAALPFHRTLFPLFICYWPRFQALILSSFANLFFFLGDFLSEYFLMKYYVILRRGQVWSFVDFLSSHWKCPLESRL